jgi:uncharacterized protein (TIGR03086 family)
VDPVTLLAQAGERTAKLADQVGADQLGGTTPCTEWDVRALLNHLIGTNHMFAIAVPGGTVPDMGDELPDFAGDDPGQAYRESFEQALAAWQAPGALDGTVKLPFGELPAAFAIGLHFMDTVVHGWDLARGTGQDSTIEEDQATAVLGIVEQMFAGGRNPSFGPEVPVPADAPAAHRLLGALGRTPA